MAVGSPLQRLAGRVGSDLRNPREQLFYATAQSGAASLHRVATVRHRRWRSLLLLARDPRAQVPREAAQLLGNTEHSTIAQGGPHATGNSLSVRHPARG